MDISLKPRYDSVSKKKLVDAGIDNEKPGYRRGCHVVERVARELGVNITDSDILQWTMVLGMLRAVDTLVDQEGQTDISTEVAILTSGRTIQGVSPEEASLFAEMLSMQTEQRREEIVSGICELPLYAMRRQAATTVPELTVVNREEAHWFAGLLKVPESSEGSTDDKARVEFNRWLERFCLTGYLFDSCFDMREDYDAGNVTVSPTLTARLKILKDAVPEAARATRMTPIRALGGIAYMAWKMNIKEQGA